MQFTSLTCGHLCLSPSIVGMAQVPRHQFQKSQYHLAAVAFDNVHGEKVIVCGRSVRWWDDEIKAKIEQRCQLYKRMVRGQYNKLRRGVKHLVMEKKLNGVVEKANADFEANLGHL